MEFRPRGIRLLESARRASLKSALYALCFDLSLVPSRCRRAARRRSVERTAREEPSGHRDLLAAVAGGTLSRAGTHPRRSTLPGSKRSTAAGAECRVVDSERFSARPLRRMRNPCVALLLVRAHGRGQ